MNMVLLGVLKYEVIFCEEVFVMLLCEGYVCDKI